MCMLAIFAGLGIAVGIRSLDEYMQDRRVQRLRLKRRYLRSKKHYRSK